MAWKTSKDRLIEFLQAELAQERLTSACLIERESKYVEEVSELTETLREAVALASMAVSQLPEAKQNAQINATEPYKPRTMAAYVQRLSELSYKRAQAKGKNLVAEIPPPGAGKPNVTS